MNLISYLSISVSPPDTLSQVQAGIAEFAEKITNTPTEVLIENMVGKAIGFGLKVLAAIIIYLLGAWIIRKIKAMLSSVFQKRNTDASIASFVQSITSISLTILLVIITVGALGVDTSSLAALLTGGGLAIGMALNGTVQNFAGGIMILVFRPFQSGDYIQFDQWEGTVTEVNIVSTKLTTVDNRAIIIPNGILSNGTINNFSHNKIRRADWNIDLEYGTSAEKAKEVLMDLLKSESRILTVADGAPADPFVGLNLLGNSSIQFTMRAWVSKEDYWPVKFHMNEKIYAELPEKGLHFPYQKLDVTIIKDSSAS